METLNTTLIPKPELEEAVLHLPSHLFHLPRGEGPPKRRQCTFHSIHFLHEGQRTVAAPRRITLEKVIEIFRPSFFPAKCQVPKLYPLKNRELKPHKEISEGVSHSIVSNSSIQLCLTLWPHELLAQQAPLSMGFPRQEYWRGLPLPPPGKLLDQGIKPRSPALQADSLPSEPPGKPNNGWLESCKLGLVLQTKSSSQNKSMLSILLYICFLSVLSNGWMKESSGSCLDFTFCVILKSIHSFPSPRHDLPSCHHHLSPGLLPQLFNWDLTLQLWSILLPESPFFFFFFFSFCTANKITFSEMKMLSGQFST